MRTPKETKISGFPQLPADASPGMRRYLESVVEALEIRLGRRGDPRDRAITARELIDSGLAVEGKPFILGQSQSSLLPIGTDVNETSLPTAPTGFGATGAYSVVILEWDAANYFPHAYTEVWRHTADQLADAVLVGISHGMMFTDQVGGGQTNYYWVRNVNTRGKKGPWNSSAGTVVETAIDVDFILELLTGSITEDAFYQSLTDKINLIDVHEVSISDIELAVSTVETNLATAESNLAAVETTLSTVETTLSTVETTLSTVEANLVTAEADIVTAEADIAAAEADISAAQLLINAAGNDIVSLETITATHTSQITNLNTTVGSNSSNITTLQQTTATNASDITSLETTVNDPTTGVNVTASGLSSLSTTVTQQGTDITTNASDITSLETTVNDPTTGLSATATGLSNLTTAVTNQGNSIATNVQDINAIEVTIGSNSSGLVQQINTVESSVNTVTGQISTLSSSVNQVNTTVNGLSTTVSQNSTSIDGLEGEYSVRIDSNGMVAGFGLVNSGTSSKFYVRADEFAIGSTTQNWDIPFIVRTSSTTIGGETVGTGVYITDAFIQNGTISTAKIGDLAVDVAKIANLAVTGAKIANATITTAKIGNLQVDTLKIANQAVTVPSGVNQDTFLTLSTAWQTVCSITVNMGTDVQAVLVSAFHNFQNTSQTSTQYDIAMKIEANGSGGGSVAQTHNNQTSVLSSMAKYGALTGNVLFTIRVKKNASAGTYLARNSGLLVQGIKK